MLRKLEDNKTTLDILIEMAENTASKEVVPLVAEYQLLVGQYEAHMDYVKARNLALKVMTEAYLENTKYGMSDEV